MELNLDSYAPSFSVIIGGAPEHDLEKAIISLEIEESLNSASMFTLNLHEGEELETQRFTWLDSKLLDPGYWEDVEIYLGYASTPEKSSEPMIIGKIVSLNPRFPSEGTPTLSILGYDHSFILQKALAKSRRTFDNERDYGDIVRKIAKSHNLGEGEIDATIKPCEKVIQSPGESDYSFLRRLADRLGYEFFIRNKKLYFRAARDQSEKAISLKWGKEIISFNPRMSMARTVSKVTVRGHNQRDPARPIIGTATLEDLGFKESKAESGAEMIKACFKDEVEISEHDLPICDEGDARTLAKALLIKANNSLIEGSCECIGNPNIRPGIVLTIEGIGKRFSGRYYVKSTKHSIDEKGYTVYFNLRRGGIGTV
ncbi:MAG: phage late control D family protein [Methanosarcinales archaeon]|nr:phage late control D family protein [Methanosarcinales archaeon]